MSRNIRLDIMYDGTRYQGLQRLKNTDNTIQGKIETILSKMTGEDILLIASGRTDAGVHALNQVANFFTNSKLNTVEIMEYLNEYLPQDIVVTEVKEVSERFHSRYNVVDKTYLYRYWTEEFPPLVERNYVVWLREEYDIDNMKEAATILIGKHDFQGFTSRKIKKSTERTIKEIKIEQTSKELLIYIKADGFLYNMVRIIVGTLLEIGLHKRTIDSVYEILETKDRSKAGEKVIAKGLTLVEVNY